MKIIIIGSKAYKELVWRIEKIEQTLAGKKLQNAPSDDDWVDGKTICRYLGISPRTLLRYRTSGDLPYQMIYHKTFYRESDVLRFIERNFSNFRNLKNERANNSHGKRE